MYTLFHAPGTASMAVHWLLIELDLPHELRRIDLAAGEHKRPEYLALNPSGVVPTLLIDGQPCSECAALLLHLGDRHAAGRLAPAPDSPQRAAYLQWMLHLANTLQPLFRQWYYPAEVAGDAAVDAVKASAARRIEAIWDRIDEHLVSAGPHLLGGERSVADFYLTMLMRWSRNLPRTALDWPRLAVLAAAMKALPSFAELYARDGLTDWR